MTWLITGGAGYTGYIGARVVRAMAAAGERVVVLDDVSTGIRDRLPADVPPIRGSAADRALLDRTLAGHAVTGVVHLAGPRSRAGRPGAGCGRWSSRPGRDSACATPRYSPHDPRLNGTPP